MDTNALTALRENVRGTVTTAEDADYDEARRVYNAMIDRRPAVIVRSANTGDVMTAVRFAAENDLTIAVRGGSHSVPGLRHRGRRAGRRPVAHARRPGRPAPSTARAEGGATWGDFNAATYPFGLATTGGIISTTGVAGLTLGGGIGYLARGFGLSCDNLARRRRRHRRRQLPRREREGERRPLLGPPRRRRQLRRRHVVRVPAAPGQGHLRRDDVLRARRGRRPPAVLPRVHRRRPRGARRVPGVPDRASTAVHPGGPPRRTVHRRGDLLGRDLDAGEKALKPIRDAGARGRRDASGRCRTRRSTVPSTPSSRPGSSTTGRRTSSPSSPTTRSRRTSSTGRRSRSSTRRCTSTRSTAPATGSPPDATAFAYRDANFATVIAGMWPDPATTRRTPHG